MPGMNPIGASPNNDIELLKADMKDKLIDDNIRDSLKSITDINKFEELKPETTGHKAGRIIAGVLGGLLLAAGIAAAAVAVTATLGVAVGVLGTVAAFAGITATSIAAGSAGCAGIGLITTSALLAPKHAEVPASAAAQEKMPSSKYVSQKNIELLRNAADSIDEENKVSFDEEALEKIKGELKDKNVNVVAPHVEPEEGGDLEFKNYSYFVITSNLNVDPVNGSVTIDKKSFASAVYENFVSMILEKEKIEDAEINKKNVQIVRMYLTENVLNKDVTLTDLDNDKKRKAFNNPQFQKELANELISHIGDFDSEHYTKCLALFIAALTPVNLDEADNNEISQEDVSNSMIEA